MEPGPGYFLYDASDLPSRKMVQLLRQTAAAKNIPLQYDPVTGYGDDAAAMQSTGGGAPSINLIVPALHPRPQRSHEPKRFRSDGGPAGLGTSATR